MATIRNSLGRGGAHLTRIKELFVAILADLTALRSYSINLMPNLKFAVVAGAAATTNIAISGIATTDTVLFVLRNAAGTFTDVTSEASITSAGNIQLSTTNTTGSTLVVVWFDRPTNPTLTLTAE